MHKSPAAIMIEIENVYKLENILCQLGLLIEDIFHIMFTFLNLNKVFLLLRRLLSQFYNLYLTTVNCDVFVFQTDNR